MRYNPAPLTAVLALAVFLTYLALRPEEPLPGAGPAPATTTETVVAEAPAPPAPAPPPPAPEPPPSRPRQSVLSILADTPDWPALGDYQHTISREDFETLLTEVFTTDSTWKEFITIGDEAAVIATSSDPAEPPFVLQFATEEHFRSTPRHWQSTETRPVPPAEKPLTGLHIAIDPGHIGGEWAKLEERWFQIDNAPPIAEGEMTLTVARLLQPQLENLGATVSLVRDSTEPVTQLRPENLAGLAKTAHSDDPNSIRKFAERLFYRTAEIRARAEIVNNEIKPDLVLCLHFNAEAWGNPKKPTLVPRTHFHILLNGAYTGDEVRLADQRFAMLKKILQRTHKEEALVGATVANVFAEVSGLPPYVYGSVGVNVRDVEGNSFLWARNLLANRLYDCPVIFMEPYVMNSTIDYPRFQAGDYEGLKEIDGRFVRSIYREYADAMAVALAKHYGPPTD